MAPKGYPKPVAGATHARLVILSDLGTLPNGGGRRRMVRCRCECGHEFTARWDHVRTGKTTSCGCEQRRAVSAALSAVKRQGVFAGPHGVGRSVEYRTWENMWLRCTSPNTSHAHIYVARGILVCERWRDYTLFLADIGERPSPQHSIDRIDNDGNYEPGNCRWATRSTQARNKRKRVPRSRL